MTSTFLSLRRIVALSVAITLFAAPIAAAQSPGAAPPSAASANTPLLSPAAFTRLIQPPRADVAPPVVADSPRPSLLRQGTTAMAREAKATAVKAPQQKSWASRHKTALIVWSAIAGGLAIVYFGCMYGWCD